MANRDELAQRGHRQLTSSRGLLGTLHQLGALNAMLLCWLATNAAFGQVAPTWQIHFTAPAACPREQDFRRALDERTARANVSWFAHQPRIVVSIRAADDGWTGLLEVESGADGVRVERAAQSPRCEDLVPALALMTALALDLDPAPTSDEASPPPVAEDANEGSTPYPAHLEGAPPPVETSSEPLARKVPRKASPRLTEGELGFLLHWRSLVGWRDRVAVAPSILWGRRVGQGFSPWLRVSGDYVASRVVDAEGLEASLTWTVAQLDACTHKWPLWGSAFLSPCARLTVGALQAAGYAGVDTPRELTRLWLSAGGGAEVAISLVGPLWLRVQGGIEALALRQRVYVDADPDHVLIEMPAALGLLGAGLGVRIW